MTVQTGTPRRRGRPGYDRETLIERSIEIFNERGYHGTSMDALARELGITKSAIYHHVGSKEDLLEQAIAQGLNQLFAVIDSQDARTEISAEERLRAVIRGSVEVLITYRDSVALLLRVRGTSAAERRALEKRREIDERTRALVEAAIAEGSLRSDIDPGLITRLLFGMVNSLTEWYRPRPDRDAETVADAVATIAFEGLRA
ncbi:TetR/AcrR family transcriptional regulator [Brevibacterium luteolum]|uniref:TetR/AcrR family transcriptional regulator n=1 Tax=Brevibacterium luteolum TaxID=199591 RepID=UPI001584930D|nr:TetR/AcrR family transcriptional regulator [Brevibacterium luteolum]MCT1657164.1 TetR/AcrR family transcriptional regulator [Brevibacterium luteolum]MCT1828653.1 TetR/AcrR family transcriptional regulator [Brevibacterium luteolum]MCT1874655.1 TetR/AcrR family transcriptional regulator [Brevibacterium luteolum]MCT1891770.1 TetR/AcrR family transcriptional regulator [Brevibacterium luteolum]MCT1894321.1 TetR/AcrR family transcriptional regulator [Brevibacterium luteolum]